MSENSASIAASRVGANPNRAVPLQPTELRRTSLPGAIRHNSLPVQPHSIYNPSITPSPLAPKVKSDNLNDWGYLITGAIQDIFKPLSIKFASKTECVMVYGLMFFWVWVGYWGVPGLAEAYPITKFAGMLYIAVLVPAALFASCVILLVGKILGRSFAQKLFSGKKSQ